MKKNSLITTNKYLKKPGLRARLIASHTKASARIEGVKISKERERMLSIWSSSDSSLLKDLKLSV